MSPQRRADHNIYLIDQIDKMIPKIKSSWLRSTYRIKFDRCFEVQDELKYSRSLMMLNNMICKTLDSQDSDITVENF